MAKKENQRIVLTRRLLQKGLLRLLEEKMLEEISVTALCKEAGVNRATFYNHYASPRALLMDMDRNLNIELQNILCGAKDVDAAITQLENACILLKNNAALVRILFRYHADDHLQETFSQITTHYEKTRIGSDAMPMDSDTMVLVSSYLYTGTYSMVQSWIRLGVNKTPRQIAELAYSIIRPEYV